jgi:hypothetical protein
MRYADEALRDGEGNVKLLFRILAFGLTRLDVSV